MTKPQMTLPTGEVLYEGDYGVTRDGCKVGPVALDPAPTDFYKFMFDGKFYGQNGRFFNDGEVYDNDIIAKWVDAEAVDDTPMTIKVGDKIRYTGPSGSDLTHGKVYEVVGVVGRAFAVLDDVGEGNWIIGSHYEPVTDTPPAPTLWRDMTDAQKGALLLAKHQGKEIEYWARGDEWVVLDYPAWAMKNAYRVAREPVVETVTIVNADGMTIGSGTVTTHNGKPDPDSIRMESTT